MGVVKGGCVAEGWLRDRLVIVQLGFLIFEDVHPPNEGSC